MSKVLLVILNTLSDANLVTQSHNSISPANLFSPTHTISYSPNSPDMNVPEGYNIGKAAVSTLTIKTNLQLKPRRELCHPKAQQYRSPPASELTAFGGFEYINGAQSYRCCRAGFYVVHLDLSSSPKATRRRFSSRSRRGHSLLRLDLCVVSCSAMKFHHVPNLMPANSYGTIMHLASEVGEPVFIFRDIQSALWKN